MSCRICDNSARLGPIFHNYVDGFFFLCNDCRDEYLAVLRDIPSLVVDVGLPVDADFPYDPPMESFEVRMQRLLKLLRLEEAE